VLLREVLEFLSRPSSISNQVGTRSSRIDVSCDFFDVLGRTDNDGCLAY
jgi:hypothetical protein